MFMTKTSKLSLSDLKIFRKKVLKLVMGFTSSCPTIAGWWFQNCFDLNFVNGIDIWDGWHMKPESIAFSETRHFHLAPILTEYFGDIINLFTAGFILPTGHSMSTIETSPRSFDSLSS